VGGQLCQPGRRPEEKEQLNFLTTKFELVLKEREGLGPKERSRSASRAAKARWRKPKLVEIKSAAPIRFAVALFRRCFGVRPRTGVVHTASRYPRGFGRFSGRSDADVGARAAP
jgi:hypothetical protein